MTLLVLTGLGGWYAGHATLLNLIGINILLALSLYVTQSCGVLSLASAAFMGIGASGAALLTVDAAWPFWAVLPVGALAAAFAGLLIGLPVLRLGGPFPAIGTLAFGVLVPVVGPGLQETGGSLDLAAIPRVTDWWHIALALVAVSYLLWQVDRSRLGHAFAAVRQDATLAAGMGINVTTHRMIAFLLGASIAGLAGGLTVHRSGTLSLGDFSVPLAVEFLAFAVVGGTGGFWGVWPAAAAITALLVLAQPAGSSPIGTYANGVDLRLILVGAVILIVIVVCPSGLSGVAAGARRRLRLRRARPAPPPTTARAPS